MRGGAAASAGSSSSAPPARSARRRSTSSGTIATATRSSRSPPGATRSCSRRSATSSASRPTARAVCADDPDVLAELAAHPDADVVLNAVVGFAGLPATIAALAHGKRLALANKESLIAGGPGRRRRPVRAGEGEIVPVDSEHSALYQALRAGRAARGAAADPHRERWPVPRLHTRGARARHRRRRAQAPHVGHGREDHHRFVDAHEQGPRGDRGPRAVRGRLRPHRRGRAPAVGDPRNGRVHRRRDRSRSSRCPTCGSRSASRSGAPDRLDEAFGPIDWTTLSAAHLRAARRRCLPVPSARLRRRAGRRWRPRGAERRQRGRGRGVPRRADPVDGHRRRGRRSPRRAAPGTFRRSPTFSTQTGWRANVPPPQYNGWAKPRDPSAESRSAESRSAESRYRPVKDPLEESTVEVTGGAPPGSSSRSSSRSSRWRSSCPGAASRSRSSSGSCSW